MKKTIFIKEDKKLLKLVDIHGQLSNSMKFRKDTKCKPRAKLSNYLKNHHNNITENIQSLLN